MLVMMRIVLTIGLFSLLAGCAKQEQINTLQQQQAQREVDAASINAQLGLTYLQQKQMPRAKEKLLLALRQDPSSVEANSAMAYYLEQTGDVKNADAYYQKAIAIATIKGGPENNYGAFLCRQGRYDEAQAYFQQAVSDPQYINTAKAYENAGICAQLALDSDNAKIYFTKALQRDPTLTRSMLQLAKLDYDTGDYKNGYQQIKTYLSTQPATAETLWLAIRLAQYANDNVAINNYGVMLEKQFPNSMEVQNYQQLKASLT